MVAKTKKNKTAFNILFSIYLFRPPTGDRGISDFVASAATGAPGYTLQKPATVLPAVPKKNSNSKTTIGTSSNTMGLLKNTEINTGINTATGMK